mgnify:CR=1 FL=1
MKNRNTRIDNYMFYRNMKTKELIAVEKRFVGKMDALLLKFKQFSSVPKDLKIDGFIFEVDTNNNLVIHFNEECNVFINELEPFVFLKA